MGGLWAEAVSPNAGPCLRTGLVVQPDAIEFQNVARQFQIREVVIGRRWRGVGRAAGNRGEGVCLVTEFAVVYPKPSGSHFDRSAISDRKWTEPAGGLHSGQQDGRQVKYLS